MAKRTKLPEITTPKGTFVYPSLHTPDYGTEDYPDENGSYKVTLVLEKDDPATQVFLAKLEPLYKAALAEAEEKFKALDVKTRKKLGQITYKPLYDEVYDPETEEPTGEIEIRAKTKAKGKFKSGPKAGEEWKRTLTIVDAQCRRIKDVPNIWSGTVGKLNLTISPFFVPAQGLGGLTFYLNGAQIIELVEGGERSAESMGFTNEEGGFSASDQEDPFKNIEEDEEEDEGDF